MHLVKRLEGGLPVALGTVEVAIEVMAGKDLVAKDRSLAGVKTSSDPYCVVYRVQQQQQQQQAEGGTKSTPTKVAVGRTKKVSKSLNPTWNEKLSLVLDGDDSLLLNGVDLVVDVYDHDLLSKSDFMGTVSLHVDFLNKHTEAWYALQKGTEGDDKHYCSNASGKLHLVVTAMGNCIPALVAGNQICLNHSIPKKIAVGWNTAASNSSSSSSSGAQQLDLDVSCVAIHIGNDKKEHYKLMLKDSTYYGNPSSSFSTLRRATDQAYPQQQQQQIGNMVSYNYVFDDCKAPTTKTHYYFVLTVVSDFDVDEDVLEGVSVRVRFFSVVKGEIECEFRPQALTGDATSVVLFRMDEGGLIEPIDHGYAKVRDFGGLYPQLASYSGDVSGQAEPFAILRSGGSIFINDYLENSTFPKWATFGVAWTVPREMDLDVSAICLGGDLEELEIVSFRQVLSSDRALKHCGDARTDTNDKYDDDERIEFSLPAISANVQHIGFVVNSYSGRYLDVATKFEYRIFNPSSNREIAVHNLTDLDVLRNKTALVMACLSRCDDNAQRWKFSILNHGAEGNVGHDNVEGFQRLLRERKLAPPTFPISKSNLPTMPPVVPVRNVGRDNTMVPANEFVRCEWEDTITLV